MHLAAVPADGGSHCGAGPHRPAAHLLCGVSRACCSTLLLHTCLRCAPAASMLCNLSSAAPIVLACSCTQKAWQLRLSCRTAAPVPPPLPAQPTHLQDLAGGRRNHPFSVAAGCKRAGSHRRSVHLWFPPRRRRWVGAGVQRRRLGGPHAALCKRARPGAPAASALVSGLQMKRGCRGRRLEGRAALVCHTKSLPAPCATCANETTCHPPPPLPPGCSADGYAHVGRLVYIPM